MDKITLTFECRDKADADELTFCWEMMRGGADDDYMWGDVGDVMGLMMDLGDWIIEKADKSGLDKQEFDRLINHIDEVLATAKAVKMKYWGS